jgi:DNA-binding NarL/FixJ family response regulator
MTQLAAERTLPTSATASSSVEVAAGPHLRSVNNAKIPTIALIDSRSLTREGLVRLLDSTERLNLIPLSHSSELLDIGPEVISQIEIVLLNLGSAVIRDPQVCKEIALLSEVVPNASIIVICDCDGSHHVGEALRVGVRGYVPTTLTSQILMGALRLVQAGGTFVPAGALTEALSQQPSVHESAKAEVAALDLCGLTPRQREVLNLLRQGKPNKIIAHELDMRESTVKVHVRQIMRKMRVSNRTEAAFLASSFSEEKKT